MPKRTMLIIAHLLGWIFFYGTIISFLSLTKNGTDIGSTLYSLPFFYFFSLFPAVFYSNLFYFTPRYFITQKYIAYFGAFLVLVVLVLQTQPFDQLISHAPPRIPSPPIDQDNNFRPFRPPQHVRRMDIISLILFLLCWVLSSAIPIATAWRQSELRAQKAEHEKTQAELSFLKAQIHPHFLFNTLNNLYSMALTGHRSLADSILKLSNIMRFVTEEVRQNFVPLEQEIECIRDYIDLQKLRLGETTTVLFEVTGPIQGKKIAPLMLMTFIENIFKYGTSKHESSTITIRIETDSKSTRYYGSNRIFEGVAYLESTGIGIENTQKRLAILYPDKHLLNITQKSGEYIVQLVLLD